MLNQFSTETFEKLKRMQDQDCLLEAKVEQLNSDMDTVLQVMPKIEDGLVWLFDFILFVCFFVCLN